MASPEKLRYVQWFEMIRLFETESDRGAAVLMAGFVDNYLGVYLHSLVEDEKVSEALFSPTGPLSSFSQRTTLAYAFNFIDKNSYEDLCLIRRIRNHFAHYPLEATFVTPKVTGLVRKLSVYEYNDKNNRGPKDTDAIVHRLAYAHACACVCGLLLTNQNQRRDAKEAAAQLTLPSLRSSGADDA